MHARVNTAIASKLIPTFTSAVPKKDHRKPEIK